MNIRGIVFMLSFCGCLWVWFAALAQESSTSPVQNQPPREDVPAPTVSPKDLRDDELAISGRYARFERMLTQMADVLGRQDPERADLLRRAIGKGRENQIREGMEKAIELLEKEELGTAAEKQSEVVASLETLLKLLQSEDRRSNVEKEKERLNGLLKDVRNVLAEQKSARASTRNAQAPSSAAPSQNKALSETEKLLESIKEHDDENKKDGDQESEESQDGKSKDGNPKGGEPKDGEPKTGEPEDGQSKDGEPKAGEPEDGKSKDSEPKAGEPKDGKSKDGEPKAGEPKDGKSKDGEPKDGKSQDGQPKDGGSKDKESKGGKQAQGSKSQSGKQKPDQKEPPQTPGREQLENAREQMQQALEELKEQQREKALQKEDKAIEELHAAAEKLEEKLKQLREEEKEMLLASLEARFQRMLAAETQIHEATVTLAATPQQDWLDQYYGQCRGLAQEQSELARECAQTVNLLREDGTSVSILLAVEDIEADMGSVANWLQESKVAELTQSVQTDIIESLKQLIETTQKEMQEMKEQEQPQQDQKQSQKKEGLVELMAEIRMLKNLQLQVNRRTRNVDGLLQSASPDDLPSLQKQVHDLSIRQKRLFESARELAKQAQ